MTRAQNRGLGATGAERTTPAAALLSRLDRVKRTGDGRWIACCPAHDDRHPSLAIRELDDGRVLVYCHAECGIDEVLGAIGLDLSDLYPDRPIEHARRERRPFDAATVLECLADEVWIVACYASAVAQGWVPNADDRIRLNVAAVRIDEALRLCNA
jgi:hypothetical protein